MIISTGLVARAFAIVTTWLWLLSSRTAEAKKGPPSLLVASTTAVSSSSWTSHHPTTNVGTTRSTGCAFVVGNPQTTTTTTTTRVIRRGCQPISICCKAVQHHHERMDNDDDDDGTESAALSSSTKWSSSVVVGPSSSSSSSSRRQWLQNTVSAAAWGMGSYVSSSAAVAATPAAVCDPSVSVWKLPAGVVSSSSSSEPRFLYLLGTAHISELSAKLAQDLVEQVHPNAVFVELDLRRILGDGGPNSRTSSNPALARVAPQEQQQQDKTKEGGTSAPNSSNSRRTLPDRLYLTPANNPSSSSSQPSSRIVVPRFQIPPEMRATVTSDMSNNGDGGSSSMMLPPPSTSSTPPQGGETTSQQAEDTPSSPPKKQQRRGFLSGLAGSNFGAAVVGNALKGMYQNLGQAGFQPGQEFVAAMTAAQAMGADIILGDQDVQVTLQRLSSALAVTDFQKLTAADSKLQQSMQELLTGGDGSSSSAVTTTTTTTTTSSSKNSKEERQQQFKQELTNYVETLKSRDRLREIMGQLKEAAPALVQVMLSERDAYMAAGMNALGEYPVITAVVGIAHQDGIERNLQAVGWQPVSRTSFSCSK